jgi:hypothetical protein
MRAGALILGVTLAAGAAGLARAQQSAPSAASPAAAEPAAPASSATGGPAPTSDQRLVFSGNGDVLSQDHGGGGGSVTWLDSRGGDVLGLGVEYQEIANAHWTDGVFDGALAVAQQTALPTTLYADLHQGSGDISEHGFNYTVADGGAITTLTPWLSAQLEERYIDIDTSHGSLPKLGVSLRLAPTLLASVSYAYAFGGNLDTRMVAVRLDYVGKSFNWVAGGAWGPVSPVVINLITHQIAPGPPLQEEYVGIGKSFGRTDWLLLGDFQDLAGFKRETVTLNCTLHLGKRT